MKQRPTVSICIPAFNEERNIVRVLEAIAGQFPGNYELYSITVLCDGGTDRTRELAESFAAKFPKITVLDDGERQGKIGRLNQMYQRTTSDILIMFDADITITDVHLVEKLVAPFDNVEVGLVGGLEIPLPPRNWKERIFVVWNLVWIETRQRIRGGESVHNHPGCVSAVRREVYSNLVIPTDIISEDEFLYFETQRRGRRFAFASDARVFYRLPGTFRDYFLQSSRFISTKYRIADYFNISIDKEYSVPFRLKAFGLARIFFSRYWLSLIAAISLQIPLRFSVRFLRRSKANHLWRVAETTK